jgi:FKBP-type peptidyl-prolyl cis-trans isomerase SlyD
MCKCPFQNNTKRGVKTMKNNERFGKLAYVHWRGGAIDEDILDDRSEGEPVKIILGSGQVCPGVEDILSTMEVGEERVVTIPPEDAYGKHDPDGVQTYPRSMFAFGSDLHTGDVFQWTNPASGQGIPVRVIDESKDLVKVDYNHPYADKTLQYWLKLEALVD